MMAWFARRMEVGSADTTIDVAQAEASTVVGLNTGTISPTHATGGQGGEGGRGGEVYNYIYPPPPPSPLPPLQQNEALDVRISRLYEAVQHLEDRLYRKWHADEKMYTADVAQRAERQRATDHYRRLVLWWLGGLTSIVVVLIVVVTWVMFWLGVVLQRFGWL